MNRLPNLHPRLKMRLRALLNLVVALTLLLPSAALAAEPAAPAAQPAATVFAPAAASGPAVARAPYRTGVAPRGAEVAANPTSRELGVSLLPAWLATSAPVAAGALGDALLPAWIAAGETPASAPGEGQAAGASERGSALLLAWYADAESAAGQLGPAALFGPMAAGQCTPAAGLALDLIIPPTAVSRGNTAGDVYTVTVTNNGTVSTTEVSLLIDPNAGFYYLGRSATVASSISGTLLYSDSDTGAPDGQSTVTVSGDGMGAGVAAGRDDDLHFPPGDERRCGFGAVADRGAAERRSDADKLQDQVPQRPDRAWQSDG